MQDTGAAVDELGRREHLVGHRGGEDLARAGRVQHAEADESAMEWFMAGAAAGNDPDLAAARPVAAIDDLVLMVDVEVRMRCLDAQERLCDNILRIVDELLHYRHLLVRRWR